MRVLRITNTSDLVPEYSSVIYEEDDVVGAVVKPISTDEPVKDIFAYITHDMREVIFPNELLYLAYAVAGALGMDERATVKIDAIGRPQVCFGGFALGVAAKETAIYRA